MIHKMSSKSFYEFVTLAVARELEYFINESNYTVAFNSNIKNLVDELKALGKLNIEFMVLFNTSGEIALINEEIVGGYIAERMVKQLRADYGINDEEEILKKIINGENREKELFISNIYKYLIKILKEIYKDIRYRKEVLESYKKRYSLNNMETEEMAVTLASILIIEDICGYLSLDVELKNIIIQNL
ncbi:hypothetical protein [Clostridium sp. YIM B02551]|uniref:hypothetical protein n=1 Tax=Clostridium sp. YIM B02551 TaxID=2910679 RepID=UPI001EECAB59|nr:hypothetical protein [Clostridium sp. YIM B02551]